MNPEICLASGAYFDFRFPQMSSFTIDDIANGLSRICRFNGQVRRDAYYSVAEHSVHVSRLVPPHLRMAALLHDAHEAFMGDVSAPLKTLLPDYRELEDTVQTAVLARFGIRTPLDPRIKTADIQMCTAEKQQIMNTKRAWVTDTYGVAPVRILCLEHKEARDFFLHEWACLESLEMHDKDAELMRAASEACGRTAGDPTEWVPRVAAAAVGKLND